MNNQDYEQKKRECWEEFTTMPLYKAFSFAFDRAYTLGKQFGNSEQVDAEGEEMLTVSRKRVQEMYAANERIKADFPDKETAHISDHINYVLKYLFDSKCLPDACNVASPSQNSPENCDSEPHISTDCDKPAEPQERFCQREDSAVDVEGSQASATSETSDTDHTKSRELKLQTAQDKPGERCVNISQNIENCDNRLLVASMAMQGILSNMDLFKNVLETGTEILSGDGISYRAVAKASLLFADALIAEAEKGAGE